MTFRKIKTSHYRSACDRYDLQLQSVTGSYALTWIARERATGRKLYGGPERMEAERACQLDAREKLNEAFRRAEG